jgi:hypothetical protein
MDFVVASEITAVAIEDGSGAIGAVSAFGGFVEIYS